MSVPSIAISASEKLQTIAWHHLQVGKLIGQGGFGEVFFGTWNGREVAIKTLKITNLPAYLAKDFETETKIMAECSACQQIVRLFAVCMESEHFAMVMEFAKNGSLFAVLHDPSIDLSWPERYQIAMDIGKGLSYLHDREILHRDLKSLNVLLDENFCAKISDFGLSKLKLETSSMSKTSATQKEGSVGTLRWKAPELFKLKSRHTKASDAYGYGMVLWEIASRQIPFGEADEIVIMSSVKEGEKEDIPADCPAEYAGLIERTWSFDPEKRPSPHYIVLQLEKLFPKPKVNPGPHIATSAIREPGKVSGSVKNNPSIRPYQSSAPVKSHAPQVSAKAVSSSSEPSPVSAKIVTPVSSFPATPQGLQSLIFLILDHMEIKNYPTLSALLSSHVEALIDLPENDPLDNYNLKINKLSKMVIKPEGRISSSAASALEKALSSSSVAAPVKSSASVMSAKIPSGAFGKAQWEKHFGDIGVEPPLPSDIEQILNAPCPFFPGKKVRETHLLTLIPQTVNGQHLTLKSLGELVKATKQGYSSQYHFFHLGEYTDPPAPATHWALLTRDVIPGSRNKLYADQHDLVASHAQKTRVPYQVPTILDAAVSIFMEYVHSGVRLYGDSPWTFTRCQEKYDAKWQLVVGGFAPAGLDVYGSDANENCGVGPLRKF
jgi:serine/threonine protein kinase